MKSLINACIDKTTIRVGNDNHDGWLVDGQFYRKDSVVPKSMNRKLAVVTDDGPVEVHEDDRIMISTSSNFKVVITVSEYLSTLQEQISILQNAAQHDKKNIIDEKELFIDNVLDKLLAFGDRYDAPAWLIGFIERHYYQESSVDDTVNALIEKDKS